MRDNWHMRLVGTAVTLVPYRRRHVATYHGWMQDEELLAATASEPLSREEEYDMQRSWRDDGGKCTFLLAVGGDGGGADDRTIAGDVNLYLNAALPDEGDDGDVPEGAWEEETAPPAGVEEKEKDDKQKEEEEEAEAALDAMMAADADGGGDFHDDYDEMEQSDAPNSECDEDDGVDSDESDCDPAWLTGGAAGVEEKEQDDKQKEEEAEAFPAAPAHEHATPSGHGHSGVAEVSVMIAVASARRHGAAGEAVRIVADWARRTLAVHTLVARIGTGNAASIALFEQRLGFRRAYECSVFGEVTFVLELGGATAERAKGEGGDDVAPLYRVEEDIPLDPEDVL